MPLHLKLVQYAKKIPFDLKRNCEIKLRLCFVVNSCSEPQIIDFILKYILYIYSFIKNKFKWEKLN